MCLSVSLGLNFPLFMNIPFIRFRCHPNPTGLHFNLSTSTKTLAVVVQSTCCVLLLATPWTTACQVHPQWVCSSSCPLIQWCYITISSSATPFSFCLQSFPASGSFPMSQLFTSGDPSIGASTSASVLLMNIQDWSPLGLTVLISMQSKGLLWVFSNTTVQKHQFFSTQPSLWSNSHIHVWLLEKP